MSPVAQVFSLRSDLFLKRFWLEHVPRKHNDDSAQIIGKKQDTLQIELCGDAEIVTLSFIEQVTFAKI